MRQRLQRHDRVVDLDDDRDHRGPGRQPSVRQSRRRRHTAPTPPRQHDTAGARVDRRSGEVRAVEALAANGDVQLAGRQRARVDRDARRTRAPRSPDTMLPGHRLATHPTAALSADTPMTPRYTTPELVRRRASASRATTTSSNGSTRSPIT